MASVCVVGAGPGLGLAVARRFGIEGFDVALVSRTQEHVDDLAAQLSSDGITARGFAADVRDRDALARALDHAGAEVGPVEVLVHSPGVSPDHLRPVLDTTHEQLADALSFAVHGPVAAIRTVLPGMQAAGRGTVLFVNGATAVQPRPDFAGTSMAFAAESAFARMLHDQLGDEDIHVAQLVIPGAIVEGHPDKDPAALADTLWSMHVDRSAFRTFATPLDARD